MMQVSTEIDEKKPTLIIENYSVLTFNANVVFEKYEVSRANALTLLMHFMKQMTEWKGVYPSERPDDVSHTSWGGWSRTLEFHPAAILASGNPDSLPNTYCGDESFLSWTCLHGWTSMTSLLLKCGANPNFNNQSTSCSEYRETPLHDALWNLHLPCLRLLMQYGADPLLSDSRFGSIEKMAQHWIDCHRAHAKEAQEIIFPHL